MGNGGASPVGRWWIPGVHIWQSVLTPQQLSARLRLRAGAVGPDWCLAVETGGEGIPAAAGTGAVSGPGAGTV